MRQRDDLELTGFLSLEAATALDLSRAVGAHWLASARACSTTTGGLRELLYAECRALASTPDVKVYVLGSAP
jgi:hypothetical protein